MQLLDLGGGDVRVEVFLGLPVGVHRAGERLQVAVHQGIFAADRALSQGLEGTVGRLLPRLEGGNHLLVHLGGEVGLAGVDEDHAVFQLAERGDVQLDGEDARLGVVHLHEVDAAVGGGHLVLHAALQAQLLDLQRLGFPRHLVRKEVPAQEATQGGHRRGAEGGGRAQAAAGRGVGADGDADPALHAGTVDGRLEQVQHVVVLHPAHVADLLVVISVAALDRDLGGGSDVEGYVRVETDCEVQHPAVGDQAGVGPAAQVTAANRGAGADDGHRSSRSWRQAFPARGSL